MNRKFNIFAVTIFLILIGTASGIVAANHLGLTVDADISDNGFFAEIDGKTYAMNPTLLPDGSSESHDLSHSMNPTMLPIAEGESLDFSYSMNPTMLPVAGESVPDLSHSMNPTMLPE